MNIYENLKKRDLIAQVTNEEKVENQDSSEETENKEE